MAMTKVKNLQLWCKKMAEGYRDVEVKDMSASWKSGLAFCAIIHRFRPDLIDYDSLSKENVFENNHLAFETAEKQLNIPAFLEAADMVAIRVPDRLSVVTYVSQYYNYFHDKQKLGGPGVKKCTTPGKKKDTGTPDSKSLTPSQTSTGNQQKNRQESIGDKCSMCHNKVYLLERHIETGKLYHRSCFRKSELSPTSKVFKRQPISAIEEGKESSSATKLRKIDDKKELGKQTGPEQDFWERRAEVKAKKTENDKSDVLTIYDIKNKPDDGASVPSWKRDRDIKTESTASVIGINKFGDDKKSKSEATNKFNNINNSSAFNKKPVKAGDLINKFKELDDRNLKSLASSDHSNNDKLKESNKASPSEPSKKDFPKAKPRTNIGKTHEKMETPSVFSQPKPTPRGQKLKEDSAFKSALKSKSPERPKTEFSRPKTPPYHTKGDFKLNIPSATSNKSDLKSPSSPPPLPSSVPPKLPTNEPPKLSDVDKHARSSPRFGKKALSPVSSPRNNGIKINIQSGVKSNNTNVPSKPARSSSPMDTSELPVASKAVIHEPTDYNKAVLVVPNRSNGEKQSREVLGGLLKSLANVRTKHDTDGDKPSSASTNKSESKNGIGANKSEVVNDTKKVKVPSRPKSSFVSQSSKLFGDKENTKDPKGAVSTTKKTITTSTTVVTKTSDENLKLKGNATNVTTKIQAVDDDMPEWKRQLEKRKQERDRPKSADFLNDKTSSKDNSSGALDWQKEAEKRKQARQGGYVDPEKAHLSDTHKDRSNRPLSPYKKQSVEISDKYVPPTDKLVNKSKSPERHKPGKDSTTKDTGGNEKKRIGLGQKFVFEVPEDVTPPPPKPPRQPEVTPEKSPTSPKLVAPSRPPPPKTDLTPSRTKHHMSPFKIQQDLKLIDSKLTQLELKGRTLEDSIRKACDEEEDDDLMISWFTLVNEKNELVRTECDYIYISRQQELEIEQENVERKLRPLMAKPDDKKTDADSKEIEELTDKILGLVNQRSKIVDSIDEDRLRYLEEDRDIEMMLQQKGFLKESKDKEVKVKKDKTKVN